MRRSDLIKAIARKHPGLRFEDADESVRLILQAMCDALAHGERIEIREFGAFTAHDRPARMARNPKTGEAVRLPPRPRVQFKAGKELRQRVDASFQRAQAASPRISAPSFATVAPHSRPEAGGPQRAGASLLKKQA